MSRFVSLILGISLAMPALSAEIYTFGRNANGTRYVKKIDRPVASKNNDAPPEPSATPARKPPSGNRGAPPPPPPIDPKAMEILNTPIM